MKGIRFPSTPLLFLCAALNAGAETRYVDAGNSFPEWPFTGWSSAATTIQDAIDFSNPGDVILVTNGVYNTGERVVSGLLGSRVVFDKGLTVQSVNGPAVTIIEGYQLPGTTNGDGAIRCVYVTTNSALIGFTLANGATRNTGSSSELRGGGAYCRSSSSVISNCVFSGNSAGGSGGGVYQGTLYNCQFTGNTATNGAGAASAALRDCTLTANASSISGGGAASCYLTNCALISNGARAHGGGAYLGTLTNCTVAGNSASGGGGAYSAALNNCLISNNSAITNGGGTCLGSLRNCGLSGNAAGIGGGGTYQGTLTNCTITGNTAGGYGGGAYVSTLRNCIIYYNHAPEDSNYIGSTLNNCCTTPLPDTYSGCIDGEPQLAGAFRLTAGSPCREAGNSNYARAVDIDGEAWLAPPSIGCDEFYSGTATGPLSVQILAPYTNIAPGVSVQFNAVVTGAATLAVWSLDDGTRVTNRFETSRVWNTTGSYPVTLTAYNASNPGGASTTLMIQVVPQPVAYVRQQSIQPTPPYASWATAATNLQDAVNACTIPGSLVLVSNGIYASGASRVGAGECGNRVAVTRPLALRSVNGPGVTLIQGNQVPGTTNGAAAVRCVSLCAGSSLMGFTLTNGATLATNDRLLDQSGGAAWCGSTSVLLSNCVLAGNSAFNLGGGISFGQLLNCTLSGNSARLGGGAHSAMLTNCTLTGNSAGDEGGGTCASTLAGCTLISNLATNGRGGGVASSTLSGCSLSRNAAAWGGGAWSSTLISCVLSNNSAFAQTDYNGTGGGAYSSPLTNCVVVANTSSGSGGGAGDGIFQSCTFSNNSAGYYGGGAVGATLYECVVLGNSGNYGGGTSGCTVKDSTIRSNTAAYGGGSQSGCLTNCVISGNTASTNGGGASQGTLEGCTVTGNSAKNLGGGASSATLYRCVVSGNRANVGGGVDNGTLNNSQATLNSATLSGGGSYNCVLNNCTLVGNSSALYGGGAYQGTLNNSIAYDNSAPMGSNYQGSALHYSCSTPLAPGPGNISAEPQLAGFYRLTASSPCRAAGSGTYAAGADLEGEPWLNPPSMGCDEFSAASAVGQLTAMIRAEYTNAVAGYPLSFSALVNGAASGLVWDLGGGNVASNRFTVTRSWASAGDYPVVLRAYNISNPGGISATVTVHIVAQQIHYVAAGNRTPASPYGTWPTAATNIQHAVGAASIAGATILVSNGVYRAGGCSVFGALSNRVAVTKPLLLKSVNGPAATIIEGTTNGNSPWRCLYLTNGAAVIGFTLANGLTLATGDIFLEQSGGGLWCNEPSTLVSNCVLTGNSAAYYGGGACFGRFVDCTITGNAASGGGGVHSGRLTRCTITGNRGTEGGGVHTSALSECLVISNAAPYFGPLFRGYGGGGYQCDMDHCTVAGNQADMAAGGLIYGSMNNCSVLSNRLEIYGFLPIAAGTYAVNMTNCLVAWNYSADECGGVGGGIIKNCGLFFNSALNGGGAVSATLQDCVVASNTASWGGGTIGCTLFNCTVVGNEATNIDPGLSASKATNSIVYYNRLAGASIHTNYDERSILAYSCTAPLPTNGIGNFTNQPAFLNVVAGDLHLQSASPCINSGNNAFAPGGPDYENLPRISGGTVDVGAYEYQTPSSRLSYVWASHYGLSTDGSADSADSDLDGLNNWQEWRAGTDPKNRFSVLKMFSPSNSGSGFQVGWQSVASRTYFLQRATHLAAQPAFISLQSNIVGQAGTTTYTDTTATNAVPAFYRVGVQE